MPDVQGLVPIGSLYGCESKAPRGPEDTLRYDRHH